MSAMMTRMGVPALVAFGAIFAVGNPAKADHCNNRVYTGYSYASVPSYSYYAPATSCSTPVVVQPSCSPGYYSYPRTVTYYSRPVVYRAPVVRYYPTPVRYYSGHHYYRPSHSGFSFGFSYHNR